jgi:hypothetical protein
MKWWRSYQAVNSIFAQKLMDLCCDFRSRDGGVHQPTVWVHGYHMMLFPQYLQVLFMEHVLGRSEKTNLIDLYADSGPILSNGERMRKLADQLATVDKTASYHYTR